MLSTVSDVVADTPAIPAVQLNLTDIPVAKIHPNPWNPNRQRDVVAKAQRESLQSYGFIDPVTVRPHPEIEGEWQIVDGEHRWRDAQEMGQETVPSIALDLDDVAARKLTIVLNETRGDADIALLASLLHDLSELQTPEELGSTLPYSSAELDHLLSLGQEDWDDFGAHDAPDAPPPPAEHELVLSLSAEQNDLVRGWLTILTKEYGVGADVTTVVVEALRRSALAANQAS